MSELSSSPDPNSSIISSASPTPQKKTNQPHINNDDESERQLFSSEEKQQQQQQEDDSNTSEKILNTIVFINKVINFAGTSIKRMHELSCVNSSWKECAFHYSEGAIDRICHLHASQQFVAAEEYTKNFDCILALVRQSTSTAPEFSSLLGLLLQHESVRDVARNIEVNGIYLVHFAAHRGATKVLKTLVEVGKLDPNKVSKQNDRSPLIFACQAGYFETVKYLIEECGANPEDKKFKGSTPLHICCGRGEDGYKIAKYLITKKKVNPNLVDEHGGFTPLHIAVMANCGRLVKLICEKSDPNHHKIDYSIKSNQQYKMKDVIETCRPDSKMKAYLQRMRPKYLIKIGNTVDCDDYSDVFARLKEKEEEDEVVEVKREVTDEENQLP